MITILQTQLVEKNNTIRSLNQKIGSDEDAALNKIHDLELLVNMLQKNLIDKNREIQLLQSNRTLSSPPSSFTRIPIQTDDNDSLAMKSKSDPEITVSAED
jgi:hypothetical protein